MSLVSIAGYEFSGSAALVLAGLRDLCDREELHIATVLCDAMRCREFANGPILLLFSFGQSSFLGCSC